MEFRLKDSINQRVFLPNHIGVEVFVKREDSIHPFVSGNKYRK